MGSLKVTHLHKAARQHQSTHTDDDDDAYNNDDAHSHGRDRYRPLAGNQWRCGRSPTGQVRASI